jgi:hypothetical protein
MNKRIKKKKVKRLLKGVLKTSVQGIIVGECREPNELLKFVGAFSKEKNVLKLGKMNLAMTTNMSS